MGGDLSDEFQSELVAAGGDATPIADLQPRLEALVARGRAAHPALDVADEAFVAYLARAAARLPPGSPPMEKLEIEDLFLACACAANAPGSIEAFDARCGARLRTAVASATKNEDERNEMVQRLRNLLFVGTANQPPRIATFGGQGPLDRWVTVVAQRQIVTAIRSEQAERRARVGAAKEAQALEAAVHPEVAYLKGRYKGAFEQAMSAALQKLPERERMVLKLNLVGGATVVQIGQMYGVSHSTVSRWLAEARELVSTEVNQFMRAHAGLDPSELNSLAGLVASQLNLSMSRLLK